MRGLSFRLTGSSNGHIIGRSSFLDPQPHTSFVEWCEREMLLAVYRPALLSG